jgi:V8-like Glu-specific endopeptidase
VKIFAKSQSTLLNTTVEGPWRGDYALGLGVNAVTGQIRASAVKRFDIEHHKAQDLDFEYELISSESDLESMISGSVQGSYNLEGVTVSASTSFLDALTVSELSLTLVAQASIEESQYAVASSYELAVKPDQDFRDKYGDYFVAGHRSGSSLYVMYQCHFTSTEQRDKFSMALAAEVPEVMSAEGSAAFEKLKQEYHANVKIKITPVGVSGVIPVPPSGEWTPETIVTVLLPWFNNSLAMKPLDVILRHYCTIDPTISGEVPIPPDVFAQLSYLYNQFWVVRAMYFTCPEFGLRLVDEPFKKLRSVIEAQQASLPSDPEKIVQLTDDTQRLLQTLNDINNRQTFYSQVVVAAKTEPAAGQNMDADKGVVRWGYGFQRGNLPGVEITSINDSVTASWKIGWNEHVFSYRDTSKVVVGWDIICNWTDGTGGDWHKVSEQIIGRTSGDVYVKSDYDRGFNWSIVWYVVDATLYPAGPWTEAGAQGAEFVSMHNQETRDLEEIWTEERMGAAKPIDRAITSTDKLPSVTRSIVGGDASARELRGSQPSDDSAAGVLLGPDTTPVRHPHEYPARTVGKLFFNMGGNPYVGSAVVVNRVGIMTAAHCLLLNGQQATDIIFVPAYVEHNAPFGKWVIDRFFWPNAWAQNQVPGWDVGFCTVKPLQDGRGVGDVVGWAGVAWGSVAGCWNNVGYPAQPTQRFPFNGQEPWQSLGSRVEYAEASTIAKLDNLTAGGSGGPWFIAESPAIVNGLFSQFHVDSQINISPKFDDWVGTFFSHVFG